MNLYLASIAEHPTYWGGKSMNLYIAGEHDVKNGQTALLRAQHGGGVYETILSR